MALTFGNYDRVLSEDACSVFSKPSRSKCQRRGVRASVTSLRKLEILAIVLRAYRDIPPVL